MSERVTWGTCPNCGERAAAGWTATTITEFDCVNGCELIDTQALAGRMPVPA